MNVKKNQKTNAKKKANKTKNREIKAKANTDKNFFWFLLQLSSLFTQLFGFHIQTDSNLKRFISKPFYLMARE